MVSGHTLMPMADETCFSDQPLGRVGSRTSKRIVGRRAVYEIITFSSFTGKPPIAQAGYTGQKPKQRLDRAQTAPGIASRPSLLPMPQFAALLLPCCEQPEVKEYRRGSLHCQDRHRRQPPVTLRCHPHLRTHHSLSSRVAVIELVPRPHTQSAHTGPSLIMQTEFHYSQAVSILWLRR